MQEKDTLRGWIRDHNGLPLWGALGVVGVLPIILISSISLEKTIWDILARAWFGAAFVAILVLNGIFIRDEWLTRGRRG
jgi:hypothetical protein